MNPEKKDSVTTRNILTARNVFLRKAAGSYWIVKTGDEVFSYQNPIMLNETSATMYELLEKGYSKTNIANHMASEYNISYEEVLKDVESFINMLVNSGLRE